MILDMSARSKLSLCQLLSLFGYSEAALLLEKHGLETNGIRYAVMNATPSSLSELAQEILRTRSTIAITCPSKIQIRRALGGIQAVS
jgi:hypothetical protein